MQLRAILKAASILLVGATLYFTLEPRPPTIAGLSDKAEHVLAFLAIAACTRLAWPRLSVPMLFVAIAALGGGIELAQWAMGMGRDADPFDWLADLAGLTAGLAIAYPFVRLSRRLDAAGP